MLTLIVAQSENRVIGRRGELPWRLSSDLRRFKQLTMGHTLIMGRKTHESIGRLLPGRRTVIVTRQPDWTVPGGLIAHSLEQALQLAREKSTEQAAAPNGSASQGSAPDQRSLAETSPDEVFVVGGAEIYRAALPWVDRIYLTRVHAVLDGDTMFPELPADQWRVVQQEFHAAGQGDDFDSTFLVLQRQPARAARHVPTHDGS